MGLGEGQQDVVGCEGSLEIKLVMSPYLNNKLFFRVELRFDMSSIEMILYLPGD